MPLYQVGMTHRSASQDERGLLAQGDEVREALLDQLLSLADEAMLLDTCGRLEVYVQDPLLDREGVEALVVQRLAVPEELWRRAAERREGRAAALHLFRVASGLDSEILGEGEILRQVKEAVDWSRQRGGLAGELGLLARHVVTAAKRVREETGLAEGALSVGSLVAREAVRQLGRLDTAFLLMIGSGEVAGLALQHLAAHGLRRAAVVSRSPEHAAAYARTFAATPLAWEEVDGALCRADLVVSATSAPHLILDLHRVRHAMARRHGRRLVIFDLAQPRDVDPRVREVRGVRLLDLADFGRQAEAHRAQRAAQVQAAEELLEEAVDAYYADVAARQAAPLIRALGERAEGYLAEEVRRLFRKGDFTPEQERQIELFAHRLVRKLLNDPTLGLKEEAAREGPRALEVARRLLRLTLPADSTEGGGL